MTHYEEDAANCTRRARRFVVASLACVRTGADPSMSRDVTVTRALEFAASILLALTACVWPSKRAQPHPAPSPGAPERSARTEVATRDEAAAGGTPRPSIGDGIPLIHADHVALSASLGERAVTLIFREFETLDERGQPVQFRYSFPTDYRPIFAAARESHEVYVLGDDGGTTVIERWEHEIPNGAWYIRSNAVTTPIGVAAPVPAAPTIAVMGGNTVGQDQRTTSLQQRRLPVFRGVFPHRLTSMEIDPEGRYLLLGTSDPHDVYQLSLVNPVLGAPVLEQKEIPALKHLGPGYLAHHVTLGRLLVMQGLVPGVPGSSRLLWVDADNDGVFERSILETEAEWMSEGFDDAVWWVPSFFDADAY